MGKNGKRPKSYYIKCAKKHKPNDDKNTLRAHLKGFLCTCNDREKDCVRETYNLLNEYADQLYGKEDLTEIEKWDSETKKIQEGIESSPSETHTGDKDAESKQSDNKAETHTGDKDAESKQSDNKESTGDKDAESKQSDNKESKKIKNDDSDESEDENEMDIEAAIAADVTSLKQQNQKIPKLSPGSSLAPRPKRRFHQIRSGAKNCIFIGTTLEDPLELSRKIMDDIVEKQQQRTKRLIRMLPVQKTCKATKEKIEIASREVAEKYLAGTKQRYCIIYKVRNNHSLNRDEILRSICKVIEEVAPECEADLKTPEVAVNVEIIKTICCISVLPDFFSKYSRYNLEIMANKNKREEEEKSEKKTDTGDSKLSTEKENGNEEHSTEETKESAENIENESGSKNDDDDSVNEKENLSVHDKEN